MSCGIPDFYYQLCEEPPPLCFDPEPLSFIWVLLASDQEDTFTSQFPRSLQAFFFFFSGERVPFVPFMEPIQYIWSFMLLFYEPFPILLYLYEDGARATRNVQDAEAPSCSVIMISSVLFSFLFLNPSRTSCFLEDYGEFNWSFLSPNLVLEL